MDITGLDKALILQVLYNRAKPLGYGFLQYDPEPMTSKEAQQMIDEGDLYFDYVKGRAMKIDLRGNKLNTVLYNRDNGPNAAEDALKDILEELTAPETEFTIDDVCEHPEQWTWVNDKKC